MKKHTPISHTFNILAALSLLFGSAMTMQGSYATASLSGQGSTMLRSAAPEAPEAMLTMATNAAPLAYQQIDASIQLVLGILLIVLGFFIHGLVRTTNERPVHITVVPKKRRKHMWYWLEMRV